MLVKIFRTFVKYLKVKKETIKQFEKTKLRANVKKQLLPKMNDGTFELYCIKIFGKNIVQAYIFYDLDNKNLANGNSTCYVCNVFVIGKFRRMGLCTRCMQTLKGVAKEKGFSKMVLGVMEDNNNAIKLYEKLGFAVTGEKYGYDAVIKDENGNKIPQKEYLLMSCNL